MMDTVGNEQLDVPDFEAVFPKAYYTTEFIMEYLRNLSLYLVDAKPEIAPGDTFDGPDGSGTTWSVEVLEDGLSQPERNVLRLYPTGSKNEVEAMVAEVAAGPRPGEQGPHRSKKRGILGGFSFLRRRRT